jgi:hypothetical protein
VLKKEKLNSMLMIKDKLLSKIKKMKYLAAIPEYQGSLTKKEKNPSTQTALSKCNWE